MTLLTYAVYFLVTEHPSPSHNPSKSTPFGGILLCVWGGGTRWRRILYHFDVCTHALAIAPPLQAQYETFREVLRTSLVLLKFLIKGNKAVQEKVFGHLDRLLTIRGVEADLGGALLEVIHTIRNGGTKGGGHGGICAPPPPVKPPTPLSRLQ